MKFLTNYKIQTKINIISLSAISIIFFILLSLFFFTTYLKDNFDNMQQKELRFKNISYELTVSISKMHQTVLTSSILNENIADTLNDLDEDNQQILKYFNTLEYLIKHNAAKNKQNTLHILQKLCIRYNSYYNMIKTLRYYKNKDDIVDVVEGIDAISQKMFEELEIFVILADKTFTNRMNNLEHNIDKTLMMLIYLGFASLILFIFFGSVLKQTIIKSLYNLDNGIEDFFNFLSLKTNKVDDIKVLYNDELGEIAQHINDNIHEAESLIKNEREFKKNLQKEVDKQTKELRELTDEIISTQKDVVATMGAIGETRSKETGHHVKRVAEYSKLLAQKYGLDDEQVELLYSASPMHDIGKVGIPDHILNKPGRLTPEEFEIMKTHAKLGYDMLKTSNRAILGAAAIISYEHHERWDGLGYPNQKLKTQTHIFGRITAIADVFDALGSDRVYKKAWPLDKILNLIKEERGRQFDPDLVDIFMDNLDELLKIRKEYKDLD